MNAATPVARENAGRFGGNPDLRSLSAGFDGRQPRFDVGRYRHDLALGERYDLGWLARDPYCRTGAETLAGNAEQATGRDRRLLAGSAIR